MTGEEVIKDGGSLINLTCIVNKGSYHREFIAKVVTEPHIKTGIIGLDLGDNFPITYLTLPKDIEII